MADLVKLEEMYEREVKLYQAHKEKADNLRKKIDEEKGQAILKSVKSLKLSPEEFKKFQKALAREENVRKLLQETGGSVVADGSGKEEQ